MPEGLRDLVSRATRLIDWVGVAGVAVAVGMLGGLPTALVQMYHASFRVPLNYNEGGVAYLSQAAVSGGHIYFPAGSFLGNVYPPFSYYILGFLGRLFGDQILVGRAVSLVAFLFAVVLIGLIGRRLTGDWRLGLLTSSLAMAFLVDVGPGYIGMNDPQMLAHAVMLAGGLLFLSRGRSTFRLLGALVLMLAAGLIKHNLLAFPLAAVLGLFLQDRRSGVRAMVYGGALTGAALVVCYALFGRLMFDSMLASRPYDAGPVVREATDLLVSLQLPIVVSLLGLVAGGLRGDRIIPSLYLGFGAVIGVGFAGGAGTSVNVYFDFLFALALAVSLGTADLAAWLSRHGLSERRARGIVALAASFGILLGVPHGLARVRYGLLHDAMPAWEAESRADIAYLAGRGEPALCQMQSLCYWAGLAPQADLFYTTQIGARHPREERLAALLLGGAFTVVQLLDRDLDHALRGVDRPVRDALQRAYHVARGTRNGVFFVTP